MAQTKVDIKSLKVGDEMPAFVTPELGVTHFVKYAGASGDFNPLHHDDTFAKARGMDGIIGHGMLTAGILGQAIARWPDRSMCAATARAFPSRCCRKTY